MLKAGNALCHHCGGISDELIYENNSIAISLKLTRTVTDKLLLSLNVPENPNEETKGIYDDIRNVTFTDSNGSLYKGKIPYFIMVNIERTSGEVVENLEFTRRCPHCNEPLYAGVGTLPLFVIATIGKSSAGKSCWIKAVHYPDNIDSVSAANFKYSLNTMKYTVNREATKVTPINEIGETTILFVHDTEKNEDVAQVMIVDIAGELFLPENSGLLHGSTVAKLIRNNIIDSFLFVDSLTDDESDAVAIYNAINNTEHGILNRVPLAYMLNKYDEIESIKPAVYQNRNIPGWDDNAKGIETMPIFTSATFEVTTNGAAYSADTLTKRIARENFMVLAYRNFARILKQDNSDMKCFIVKTCKPIENSDYGRADYARPVNVMDPLLYLLNCLDIFPFSYKEKK